MDTSKIIIGTVGGGRYTVTAPIVKEDYGLYLKIEGLELPSTYEVDFSNSEHNGTSVTMIGNSDGVLIPHQFIDSGKDVFAFLYHVGVDFGRTVYKFRIPNKVRPDRTNEQPTPEEQSVIDQAIAALNDAVEQTAQAVVDAEESAQASAESAQASANSAIEASLSESNAERAKGNAQASAESASASATASAQSASQSAQIKDDVESMVDDAQASATASAQSATASANSASQASGYAQSASASAQSASGYASQAQTSAQTASTKAQDASGYAQTASQKATESAQSASQALSYKTDAESAKTASQTAQGLAESARDSAISAKNDAESAKADAESARDEAQQAVASISGALAEKAPVITDTASGAIASFSDGADDLPLKSLVVDINPIQDLHGQDAPYPAGGGKNKFNYDGVTSLSGLGNNNGVFTNTNTDTRTSFYPAVQLLNGSTLLDTITLSGTVGRNSTTFTIADTITTLRIKHNGMSRDLRLDYPFTQTGTFTISMTITANNPSVVGGLSFNDVQIESGSTATSYAPYENLCPISGWTEVDVEQSGVNVGRIYAYSAADLPTPQSTPVASNAYGTTISTTDSQADKIVITQTRHDGSTNASYLNGFFVVGVDNIINGQRYYFRAKVNVTANPLNTARLYGLWNGRGNAVPLSIANGYVTGTFVASISDERRYLEIRCACASFEMSEIMFMLAEDMSSPYKPYTGRSITIDLGQTVYGGTLNVLTGELAIDRAKRVLNGSEVWSVVAYQNHYRAFTPSASDMEPLTASAVKTKIVCDTFGSGTWNNVYVGMSVVGQNGTYLGFGLDALGITTVEGVKAWLADNPITIAYPLATPITIQLSANQLNSLYGVNNIWADSGDTEVVYRADTKFFIERLTAPDSADMIADSNITSGQYFMVGNTLYKATANIANGGQITVGTNCTRVSLAQALNEINA